MRRREFLGAVPASLVAGTAGHAAQVGTASQSTAPPPPRKGRIKQGITRGVFSRGTSIEDSCREAAKLGIKGFDLIGPDDRFDVHAHGSQASHRELVIGNQLGETMGRGESDTRHTGFTACCAWMSAAS